MTAELDPPEFHLFLPQMRMTHEAIIERARAAETAGFEGIAFMDHVVPPLAAEQPMWEAMSIASWVLAHTTTLSVGHLVLCDSLRHPAMLAKQATSLDHASGGRFELGIGWGSVPDELDTFGVSTTGARGRAERLGETLAILRGLWTGEPFDYAGEHFTLRGARQQPVPTRSIPITIGGVGPRTLALVREHADWWNLAISALGRLDELRPQVGGVGVSVQQTVAVVPSEADRDEVTATARRRYGGTVMGEHLAIGTPPELTDHFAQQHRHGIGRFYVWFTDFAPVETITRFGEVIAALR